MTWWAISQFHRLRRSASPCNAIISHSYHTLSCADMLTTPEVRSSDTSSESQENTVSLLVTVFSLYFWPWLAGYSGLIYFTVNLLSLHIWAGRSLPSSPCPCTFLHMFRLIVCYSHYCSHVSPHCLMTLVFSSTCSESLVSLRGISACCNGTV